MKTSKKFHEKSYEKHDKHLQQYASGGLKENHAKTWFNYDTVDAWRHNRMYHSLDPILKTDTKAKWLTVGDGKYGKDAKYIEDNGSNALATDISDILLKEAKAKGFIKKIKKENAESLSFKDDQFDYVFCKESYHHFPRPALALYEMLRVAKKGIVLIEPNDSFGNTNFIQILFRKLLNIIKPLFGKKSYTHSFEESGNYMYTISRREIEKFALGLNYRVVAFKGINDVYFKGIEYQKISEKKNFFKKIKRLINIANFFCKIGFMDYIVLAAIILKEKPSDELFSHLKQAGYKIVVLPENPYINQ